MFVQDNFFQLTPVKRLGNVRKRSCQKGKNLIKTQLANLAGQFPSNESLTGQTSYSKEDAKRVSQKDS